MAFAMAMVIAGAAGAFYILFGYPILLAFLPFKKAPAVRKNLTHEATVTLIMAVYNGAAHIRQKLETILALDYPRHLLEIIVVSDGSTDSTESMVAEYSGQGVQLIRGPHAGKATALNLAFEKASGEILFFTDVRQPLDPMALRHLVANFADPTIGAVTGEMRLVKGEAGEQIDMDLYWRYELWARTQQTQIDSIFNTTGCIYAIRRNLVKSLYPDTLSDDAALPLMAFFAGYRVIFDPNAIALDYPAIAGTEFRRRFRNLAGLWQTFTRFPELFSSKDRMRFHFLSHKFGRLMMPWCLLLAVAGSLILPWWPTVRILVLCEAAFVLLAFLDLLIPRGFPLKRLTSPPRTFLLMNTAALVAIVVFFMDPKRLWRPTNVKS